MIKRVNLQQFNFSNLLLCEKKSEVEKEPCYPISFSTSKNTVNLIGTFRDRRISRHLFNEQISFALIIIDAISAGFEAFLSENSITRNDISLAHTMGLNNFIVAINKMDDETVAFSEARFIEINKEVSKYMLSQGIDLQNVSILPISALKGDNVIVPSSNMPWWEGKTLLESIDCVPAVSPLNHPFRASITGAYNLHTGTLYACYVSTGVIKTGMKIVVEPSGVVAEVVEIVKNHQIQPQAVADENVGIKLIGSEISKETVKQGYAIGDAFDFPPRICKSFTAYVLIHDYPGKITPGFEVMISVNFSVTRCRIEKLIKRVEYAKDNFIITSNPEYVKQGNGAVVQLVPYKPISADLFPLFDPMSCIAARDIITKRGIANGVILSVEYVD